jgi:hypothetical protein
MHGIVRGGGVLLSVTVNGRITRQLSAIALIIVDHNHTSQSNRQYNYFNTFVD